MEKVVDTARPDAALQSKRMGTLEFLDAGQFVIDMLPDTRFVNRARNETILQSVEAIARNQLDSRHRAG